MKSFHRVILIIILLLAALFVGVNLYYASFYHDRSERSYRVEINRIHNRIKQDGIERINPEAYSYVRNISVVDGSQEEPSFFEGDGSDYVIKYINGAYYRFDYQIQLTKEYQKIQLSINIIMLILTAVVLGILIYVRNKLIKPFYRIKEVPFELSKGNLNVGLKESKSRFFGRFIWGLDLLREKLEEQKAKELSIQKEKKTLVLSISHDIKTPLSSIKLYSKALSKNLYDSDEKRTEIAENIGVMADKIEGFVSDIIKASSEDFLHLEVSKSEFYLDELIDKIRIYYSEKLELLKTDFNIEEYSNCLILGDLDRANEVLQNILENAIKYGDGSSIRLEIDTEEDYRLITIANSGCTLSENELPYIFNSFWRGSNATNSRGSGLGLYICRQLMLKMEGDIFAKIDQEELLVTAVFKKL